jgi:hypothetical protein
MFKAMIDLKKNLGTVEVDIYPTYVQQSDDMEYIAVEPFSDVHTQAHTTMHHALRELAYNLEKHYASNPSQPSR